jgi:hypothetical protein
MDSETIPEEVIVEPVVEPVPPIDPNLRIIYPTPEGGVAIIIPAPDCGLTAEQIAAKDVPAGVPFRIVEADTIPTDRTFRNAWEFSAE